MGTGPHGSKDICLQVLPSCSKMLPWLRHESMLLSFPPPERGYMPDPAEKTNGLIEQLSDLRHDRRKGNALALARVEKEIGAVKRVNPSGGLMLEGMLETIRMQKDKAVRAFECALNAGGMNATVLWNFGSSLLSFGLFEEAEKRFLQLAEYPDMHAIISPELFRMGKYQIAGGFGSEQNQDNDIPAASVRLGLTDQEVSRAVQIAGNMLVNRGHLISGARILVLDDRIVHYILVAADPETLATLDYDLAESFLDHGVDINRLVVSFMGFSS